MNDDIVSVEIRKDWRLPVSYNFNLNMNHKLQPFVKVTLFGILEGSDCGR
jgi:hypothetical protein